MYRDLTLWSDPNGFHPERWLGNPRYSGDSREAFKPFFMGSRDCIGQKYAPVQLISGRPTLKHLADVPPSLALLEMRLILAYMVFHFDLKATDDPNSWRWVSKQKNTFIIWVKTPLPVQLTPVR